MGLELPLDRLQRWMQGAILHEGAVEDALAAPEVVAELPPERIGDVLLPSKTLKPAERLDIYHAMYPLRMYDTLAADYPGLEHFVGEDGFRELLRDYTRVHPSRSYTLNRLGDHLPDFVKTARVRRPDFCHELARLELAISHVFDAEETPRLTEAQIAAVPPEAWARAVLRPGGVVGYHTAPLRIEEVLLFLRERYGLYIDRLPPGDGFGTPSIQDRAALRENVVAFTARLREIGFYRDLSDAYVTQTVTPRYVIDMHGTMSGGEG